MMRFSKPCNMENNWYLIKHQLIKFSGFFLMILPLLMLNEFWALLKGAFMASRDLSQVVSWSRPVIRLSGVDFDQDGRKSTLEELLQLGGLFPLARIKDRLPFPARTVRNWGKGRTRELAPCIVRVCAAEGGRAHVILIHLDALSHLMEEVVEDSSMRGRERKPLPLDALDSDTYPLVANR